MSPPSSNDRAAKRVQWLLLVPTCLPGALMLVAAWMRGALWPTQDQAAAMFAQQQADQLYVAGIVALAGGLLMAAFIAWKILRPTTPEEETDAGSPDRR